ncbi:MAG: hypothetical protein ACN4GG_04750 [Akkermansiaceae bacterium]
MKLIQFLLFFIAVLPAAGQSTVVYTTPSGYVKYDLQNGFNYLGLTVHETVIASGIIGTPAGTTLPTSIIDLTTSLGASDANSKVIIEITGGDHVGYILEATAWSGADFTGVAGLGSLASLEGDTFQVRKATSISDLFGATNTVGLTEGTLQTADVIWVSAGSGGFDKYFYSPGDPTAFPVPIAEGWKDSVGNDASNAKINYLDGIFIQRRGSLLSITVFGEIKTTSTNIAIEGNGFNFFSGIYPAATTLSDSNLSTVLTHGDLATGDIVWMPDGVSSWKKYYYTDGDPSAFPVPVTAGWKDSVGADASAIEITSGMVIQRRSTTATNALYTPHILYNSL